jgi:ketosteroid isomerase-like protein
MKSYHFMQHQKSEKPRVMAASGGTHKRSMTMTTSIRKERAAPYNCPTKRFLAWLWKGAKRTGNTVQRRFSRRSALTMTAAMILGAIGSRGYGAGNALQELVDRTERQANAFVSGDMETWIKLIRISHDFTLMQPFGGPTSYGFDPSPKHLAQLAAYFRGGKATIDVQKSYVTPEMIVLVFIERQDGEVGGLPKQDWSLRVTQVYRRFGNTWEVVHRHADPLVRKLPLEKTAAIARGE